MIKRAIIEFFGSYAPIYTEADGVVTIASGAAGVDWVWIAGVVIFIMFLYIVLTFIRMLFKR